ncbi:PAS-domain containing protein [uncultured Lentibacter sp.]|uniref:PAS-domain containing protein n=1 Tax=uncultured Lentibacter sp. TaxID=1659309 RepID=UPI002616F32F|nr:PAS-domain containing protein [uncultured Lentibacter sp.]
MNTSSNDQAMTMAGLNLIQQALSIYDSDLRLVVSNARFRQMFALPDWIVSPGADFAATIRYLAERGEYGAIDDIDAFVQERVALARAFEPHYIERQMGNGRWISVEGSPLPNGGWVAVYTDITGTKRQEELLRTRSETLSDQLLTRAEELASTNRELEATITALEEAKRQLTAMEARTRLTTEMMPAHIAHVSSDQVYTFSNRRVSSVMPGSLADPVGHHAAEVLGPQPYSVIAPHLERGFAGKPSVFEFTHEPSSRRIRVALTPDASTGGVYILSMDITEETQTRAALQQTRRRELAAQMVSGLAHDFSNLLTIVLGSQSRLQNLGLEPKAQDLISATLTAARRGGDLLNRIADMTGHRDLHPQPVLLKSFLAQFQTLAQTTLPEGQSLEIKHDSLPSHLTLMLDAGMLQDSLLNLVLNARDACRDAGQITLSVQTVKDLWIEFLVCDTGPGFSKHALAHVFDPFFTTKGDGGSGLGLAMVYDMAKLSGGQVQARNSTTGAEVSLRLPIRHAPAPVAPGLALLVEDNPVIRTNVREMLVAQGHSVIEATSVDEALVLAQDLPDIALVLSDISLEGEATGLDLLNKLGATRPPSFLMTSLPETDPLFQRAIKLAPVLRKPFTAQTLATYLGTDKTP